MRAVMLAVLGLSGPALADSGQAMRTALDLASGKDWDGALAVAPSGVGVDIIEWQRLRADNETLQIRHPLFRRVSPWQPPLLRFGS